MFRKISNYIIVPIVIFLLYQYFYYCYRGICFIYIKLPLITFLNKITNNNYLLTDPIVIFICDVLIELLFILSIIFLLRKLNFNLKILKQIKFINSFFFILFILVIKLTIFFVYTSNVNISNTFFKFNNQFQSFEIKYHFYWNEFIDRILQYILRAGLTEELLNRVLFVFIIYKFSKSVLWSVLLSSMLFNLSHFIVFNNSFPFLYLLEKHEVWYFFLNDKLLGGINLCLILIINNNLIVPLFYHFLHNLLNYILIGEFKPLIECTVRVAKKNSIILGTNPLNFLHILTNIVFLLILIIIFLRKRKYYLERYEENWLKPVSKLISKTES